MLRAVPVTTIARRTRADDVVERIEKMIASGEFAVGSDLPSHKELMRRFGVGRPAVREALFFLQQRGLIDIGNGRRARVVPGTNEIIVQQLAAISRRLTTTAHGQEHVEQARLLLESGLAWLCAKTATDADIKRLKAALDANVAAVGNAVEFIRTDVAFHYEIAAITRNPIFTSIHEVVVDWLIDQRTTTNHMPDADKLSVRDHTAIYEAIAARDPVGAFHEMSSHLQLVSRLYHEAKRLSHELMRSVTHDVAQRFERERESMWKGLRDWPEVRKARRPRRRAG
jgi:GntR family transcriptional repressor for pyruvate dehydrogenase complex